MRCKALQCCLLAVYQNKTRFSRLVTPKLIKGKKPNDSSARGSADPSRRADPVGVIHSKAALSAQPHLSSCPEDE